MLSLTLALLQISSPVLDAATTVETDGYDLDYQHVVLGDQLLFVRNEPGVGTELFRAPASGGTPTLVVDLHPGPAGSFPDRLTVLGDKVLFVGSDGQTGRELWATDGTAAGTELLAELRPGIAGGLEPSLHRAFDVHAGRIWFRGDDGVGPPALWTSDGTVAGTFEAAPDEPYWFDNSPSLMVEFDGDLFYAVDDIGAPFVPLATLRRIDPVTFVEQVVSDFRVPPRAMAVAGGKLFLNGNKLSGEGTELYVSDGTPAGTQQVADLNPSVGARPESITPLGDIVLFTADDGTNGRELWRSDGTAAGTWMVADISLGPDGSSDTTGRRMPVLNGVAYFHANPAGKPFAPVPGTLWRSDGTAAGTFPVVSGPSAPETVRSRDVTSDGVSGGLLYFRASDASGGIELWRSDGTAAGTQRVSDLYPGAEHGFPSSLVADGAGGLRFLARDASGPSIWTTSGDMASTQQLVAGPRSVVPRTRSASPLGMTPFLGTLAYVSWSLETGYEPWTTDGTTQGTALLRDTSPGPSTGIYTGDPEFIQTIDLPALAVGSKLFFTAYAPGQSLHVSDGTPEGTEVVKTMTIFGNFAGELSGVGLRNVLIYAGWETSGTRRGIWRSDGTPQGTLPLFLPENELVFSPVVFERMGRRVFFGGPENSDLNGLWRTEGTPFSTVLVAAQNDVSEVAAVGKSLFYSAKTEAKGRELWVTDGELGGETLVTDLFPGNVGSAPADLTAFGDRLVFSADAGATGRELWITDGTEVGTQLLVDSHAGIADGSPSELTVQGDRLYFVTERAGGVRVLWVTDGTQTTELLELGEGTHYSFPSAYAAVIDGLTAVGSRRLWFRAAGTDLSDGVSLGFEQWTSDGTPEGTLPLEDYDHSGTTEQFEYPLVNRHIAPVDGRVVSSIADDGIGSELHTMHPGATAMPIGEGCSLSGFESSLRVDDPVLGGVSRVAVEDGAPLTPGQVLFSIGKPVPTDFGAGCVVFVDPATALTFLPFTTDAEGGFAIDVPIPAEPALSGLQLVLQGVIGNPASFVEGAGLTEGSLLTLGL